MHPQPSSGTPSSALALDVFDSEELRSAAKSLDSSALRLADEAMEWMAHSSGGGMVMAYANVFAAQAMRKRTLAARFRRAAASVEWLAVVPR